MTKTLTEAQITTAKARTKLSLGEHWRRLDVLRSIRARRGQAKFRNGLIDRYGARCMISGCEIMEIVEAAHIWPYRGDEDHVLTNGLLMRSDLHTLFDYDLIGIDPVTLTVRVGRRSRTAFTGGSMARRLAQEAISRMKKHSDCVGRLSWKRLKLPATFSPEYVPDNIANKPFVDSNVLYLFQGKESVSLTENDPGAPLSEFSRIRQQTGLSVPEIARRLGVVERTVYRWDIGETKPKKAMLDQLRSMIPATCSEPPEKTEFTFIDLFAGIGGLRRAFQPIGGRCVFTSEWNEFAQNTYAANFRDNRPIEGDITKIDADDIPDHDVLLAGFPCQPFSIAGVSKKNSLGRLHGFACEAQGTLFFDVARILLAKEPAAFMLENVKNLQSHDKGRTFDVIIRTLQDELGYKVFHKVIDAKHFLPQHRERIVIVGFRDDVPFSWDDLNLPEKGSFKLRDILHPEDGSQPAEHPFTEGDNASVASKYTLTPKLWEYLQNYAAKHKAKGNGFGFGLVGPDDIARTLSARYFKDGSEILVSRGKKKTPRRLTPRECARLMGYPDDFIIPVSDTQAYKQFGNSVAVPVFSEVARIMVPHIKALLKAPVRRKKAA